MLVLKQMKMGETWLTSWQAVLGFPCWDTARCEACLRVAQECKPYEMEVLYTWKGRYGLGGWLLSPNHGVYRGLPNEAAQGMVLSVRLSRPAPYAIVCVGYSIEDF